VELNMFLSCLGAAAFSIATVLANADFALAAEQSITPMAGTECEAMAQKIGRAAGIPLKTRVGKPDLSDRVLRFDPANGGSVEYLLPRQTNVRRVFVDNSTTPVTFWVGNNHGASIVKLEPLD
jgi:hypothetical protein